MERTLVLIKPDAIQRDLVGEVIGRIERKGLKLVGMKMITLPDELLDEHYSLLRGFTKAREADPGTIRGDLAMSVQANLVHASDSLETAEVEVKRFFRDEELFEYEDVLNPFVYSSRER